MRIRARKLTKGSLLKLLFTMHCLVLLPFTLLCGIASKFGAHTVVLNNKPVTGTKGLMVSLLLGPFFCVFLTAFLWVIYAIALWVYSIFSPIELEFVDGEIISSQPPEGVEVSQAAEPGAL
jgi:hypothetical protein